MPDRQLRAMRLKQPGKALDLVAADLPQPTGAEVVIEVRACGVCRTDLHIVDGEVTARGPIVPGHEIVGRVVAHGPQVLGFAIGQRIGVPWLAWTCGKCDYCRSGRENLCDKAAFTGLTRDGGFASHCLADSRYCLSLPDRYDDISAAPLLCAGLIGYRAYRAAGDIRRLGLFGFGAAAHLIAQVAIAEQKTVFAFARPGDEAAMAFARSLGCAWAGGSDELPPEPLDAAILFAPVGALVPAALKLLRKAGTLVCAGIHMSDIPAFPYADLWGERSIRSVANLTRADGAEFMRLAAQLPLQVATTAVPLEDANEALASLRAGSTTGAIVLVPGMTRTVAA